MGNPNAILMLPFLLLGDALKKKFHKISTADAIIGADVFYRAKWHGQTFPVKIRTVFAEQSRLTGQWDVKALAVSPSIPFARSYLHLTDRGLYQDWRDLRLNLDRAGRLEVLKSKVSLSEAFDLVREGEEDPPQYKYGPARSSSERDLPMRREDYQVLQQSVVQPQKDPAYWRNRILKAG